MLVLNDSQMLDMYMELDGSKYVALDLETTGLDMVDSEVMGIALATRTNQWYVDLVHGEFNNVWGMLGDFIHSGKHTLISHNAPFDMHFVNLCLMREKQQSLYNTFTVWWDTMSMASLLDENMINVSIKLPQSDKAVGALSLKALSYLFLNRQQTVFPGLEEFAAWSAEEQAEYAAADARNCYDLAIQFSNLLKAADLLTYYRDRLAPMSYVTLAMEENGIKVDIPKLLGIQQECATSIEEYTGQLREIVPPKVEVVMRGRGKKRHEEEKVTPFNPNSSQQLGEYLLSKKYKLPLTPSGKPSVAAETIEALAKAHPNEPIFGPLIAMKQLEKMQGTYVKGCLKFAWEDDTVHPEWNSVATVTGRLSATTSVKGLNHLRGPALQTIPRPDTLQDAGWPYNPREWFIARPGNCFAVADLSQAEVRMLAVMSQDEAMIEAVNTGTDVHVSMAQKAYPQEWEVADDAERKKIRSHSKGVTFGRPISYAEVKSAQLLETLNGNQQPEEVGILLNGSETHSMTRQVMVWDAQA